MMLLLESASSLRRRREACESSVRVRPSDLNQRVAGIEKEVSLQGDNTLAVRMASNTGGFLTVSIFCLSGCLDVEITAPAQGSTLNRAGALVQGHIINYGINETGIRLVSAGVEGEAAQLAQVQGDFFAGLVPLQQGENTITAIATDACGYQAGKEITVQTDLVGEDVHLSAWPASGILPVGGAGFGVTLEAEVNLHSPAVHYAWDFEGDGTVDRSGSDLSKTAAHYPAPGLYLPTLTVTDAQGRNYSEATVVQVFSREEFDALLG